MHTSVSRADGRIVKMLHELRALKARTATRVVRPGPRQLQRLSTRELVHETVRRQQESGLRWDRRDRDRFAAEYRRRDLPTTADLVAGVVTGAAAVAMIGDYLDQPEVQSPADVDAVFAESREDFKGVDEVVESTPLTFEERIADAQDMGVDPSLVSARETLDTLELGGVSPAPSAVSTPEVSSAPSPDMTPAPSLGM